MVDDEVIMHLTKQIKELVAVLRELRESLDSKTEGNNDDRRG